MPASVDTKEDCKAGVLPRHNGLRISHVGNWDVCITWRIWKISQVEEAYGICCRICKCERVLGRFANGVLKGVVIDSICDSMLWTMMMIEAEIDQLWL